MYRRNFPRTKERHTPLVQMCKVFEEANEAEEELEALRMAVASGKPTSNGALLMELLDIVHAVETMIDDMKATQEQVATAYKAVLAKNMARGYYEERR